MASTKYTYSISGDFSNQVVASDRLTQEIQNSDVVIALDYINTAGDDCDIWFKDSLDTADLSELDSVIAAHTGVPLPYVQDVNIKSADADAELNIHDVAFPDRSGYNIYIPGHRFVCTKDTVTNCDISYSIDYKLQGMGFHMDGNPVDGDTLAIQIVDVDGIVYPAGTVLITFATDMFVWAGREYSFICSDVKTIYSWMYLRLVYDSVGTTGDVVLYWEHFLRTIPT